MTEVLPNYVDVAVVGAGVAGTAVATLLKQSGLSVLLLDQRRTISDYKELCTHFVQPFANSIFTDLGVEQLLDSNHSVKTKAVFYVPGGKIDTKGGYGNDSATAFAHNLERRVMDPILRQNAIEHGVMLMMDTKVVNLACQDGGFILAINNAGLRSTVQARFVVAADGRNSKLAKLTEVQTEYLPNDRAAYFCYCCGIAPPQDNRSLFVLHNSEMSFLYPLIQGRSLLSVYITAERSVRWGVGRNVWPHLLALFKTHLPAIDFSQAEPDSQIFFYRKYDNQIRPPVFGGVAFIGDASLSIDPMSGVGCSFSLKAARLLADAIVANPDNPEIALLNYAKAHEQFFSPHVKGIVADSRVTKTDAAVAATYEPILDNVELQQLYLDLTARLITPRAFQKGYMKALTKKEGLCKEQV